MHQLRVFALIVENGSMTAAAAVLGISKSVVSGHLKHLEDALGVRLLERTTRQMALTRVGQEIYEAASRMVVAGADALAAAEAEVGHVSGVLRVACPVDLGPPILLPVVRALKAAHPALRIEAHVSDDVVDLIGRRVEVGIRIGRPEDSGLIMRRLGTTDEIVVCSPEFASRCGEAATPAGLIEAPWIRHGVVYRNPSTFHNLESDSLEEVHWPPPALQLSSSDLMRRLAGEGHGFAVLPDILVRADLTSGRLVRVLAPWIRRRLDVYVAMPSRTRSRRREVFLETLVRVVENLVTTGAERC